jgi:hypothetical protein
MTESEWLDSSNPHAMLAHLKQPAGSGRSLLSWLGIGRDRRHARPLLLFAVACCRRIEGLLVDQRSRCALDIAERLADGGVGRRERALAAAAANAAAFDASSPRVGVGGWLASAQARAAEAVAAVLAEPDSANVAAARAKEAVRAWAKARPTPSTGFTAEPSPIPSAELSWNAALIVAASSAVPAVPSDEAAWANEARIQCEYLRDIFGNPFQPVAKDGPRLQKSAAAAIAKTIYEERSFGRLLEVADILCKEGFADPAVLAHCRQPGDHVRGCWVIDRLLGL